MLDVNPMSLAPQEVTALEVPLHLLLFIDDRPSLKEDIQQIRNYLHILQADHAFRLQVIEVGDQPYLAELFKVVATPTLVKIHPDPKQTLSGSTLVEQLQKCWDKWQQQSIDYQASLGKQQAISHATSIAGIDALGYSSQMIRLTDEVFLLKQEKEKLLEQLRFKEQVLSMLAHDLRSPLTAASLALETVELAHQAYDSSISMPPLIEQLLRQARNQFKIMDRMMPTAIVLNYKYSPPSCKLAPSAKMLSGNSTTNSNGNPKRSSWIFPKCYRRSTGMRSGLSRCWLTYWKMPLSTLPRAGKLRFVFSIGLVKKFK